jgi:hypothetical protein
VTGDLSYEYQKGHLGIPLKHPTVPPKQWFGEGGKGKFNKTYLVAGDSGIQGTAKQAINHLL